MPLEKKDVEAMIKAEVAKLSSKIDALEKKVDAHQSLFNQRDEDRRKKLDEMKKALEASGKSAPHSKEIEKSTGLQLNEMKNKMTRDLKEMLDHKANQQKVQDEMMKTVKEVEARVDKLNLDERLKRMEAVMNARLQGLEAAVNGKR